jgi:hypothetical protein
VLATFATERTDGLLADGESAASALNSGYHLAYLIGAGLVLVAIATAFGVLRSPPPDVVPEPAHEPAPVEADESGLRAYPLPARAVLAGGCLDTGTGVVIGNGCGGCAGSRPR